MWLSARNKDHKMNHPCYSIYDFESETPYTSTRNVLRRVMVQALTCGFTTAISTTLMTIFLFTFWNACYSLFSVLGRIYSLTVLSTLILLKVMRRSDPSTARMDGDRIVVLPEILWLWLRSALSTHRAPRRRATSHRYQVKLATTLPHDKTFVHTI
ncbi:uncharacterized protein ARMOST_02061 [Armillaria ostoyae]|uniref:Uncharacterized protein n=1 Tax=Armillaria ostoyae TaxID=47428 RepID=A0A284QQN6_ARMOS|nr:uncharacterized protein ARMOST_02061 [Armillaria ostoyae]